LRTPKYLSYSGLSLWEKDKEEFYLRHLAETRPPKIPQENFMSIGSAFDAYVKSELHAAIFGPGADPQFEFDAIFVAQVEEHNRDWAREHAKYVYDCYVHTGSYDELLTMLKQSIEPPKFESKVDGLINGVVPFTGKPDCRFVLKFPDYDPVRIILDWKVKGYCSKYGASPSKGYALCRDGYDAIKLGIDKTKKEPLGKQSKSHGTSHDLYLPMNHRGFTINTGYMEDCNSEYADQVSIYGWLLGETPGDENVVTWIDELVCKFTGDGNRPLLRVANHRARVRGEYQKKLLNRAYECWDAITSGYIFRDVSRDDSDSRAQALEQMSIGLQSTGTAEDDWFNEVVRKGYRK
jgi:hypothetical protein